MSKQVERKGDNLIVRTREDYKSVSKVIFMKKGETAKVFYPVIPTYINDLEIVKGWTICGYSVEELYKLALILRDKHVDELDLKDFNGSFMLGYERATEDLNKQLEESVKRFIDGFNSGDFIK